jgi:hypothetical protein
MRIFGAKTTGPEQGTGFELLLTDLYQHDLNLPRPWRDEDGGFSNLKPQLAE